MVLKRKRSESELSFGSSSAFSSPQKPDQFTFMDLDGGNTSPMRQTSRSSTPAHLHSRTMKRFRDSRPSDEEIHQRTLNMLYTAQKHHIVYEQQQQHAQLQSTGLGTQPLPQPLSQNAKTLVAQGQTTQASLHSFWKLPAAAAAAVAPSVLAQAQPTLVYDGPSSCEDCGHTLREGTGVDPESMDVDGFAVGVETSCGGCGKHVCSHCSITNLGEQRQCLICAGKKVWVGGLGWAGIASLKVC
ncbi:hypothetical protein M426DRAFT_319670 [Hypoxylon sp. CI-4A]|nr:hypothetical protein M426DRAFT_319670 [Hypoxylon sp. CI-4A]